jgi:sodium-dependent dicarboxylate transporter 2/3/5
MKEYLGIFLGLGIFIQVLLLPLDVALLPVSARYTAAITLLMVVWWITEALPIYATALVPLVLFPVFGVLSPDVAARAYADQTVFLFMGGFFIAVTMQKWNLHRRIALFIVRRVGLETRKIVLGFMIATAFVSMWISNTATAMMMTSIALAMVTTMAARDTEGDSGKYQSFSTCLILGVAYAATIGGMATLIGTPPNGILIAQISSIFPEAPPIDFFSFMLFATPLSALLLIITWLWLTYGAFRHLPPSLAQGKEIILEEARKLGAMTKGEKLTLIVFVLTAFAWIFRTEKNIGAFTVPGIVTFIPGVQDATIAITGALLLFLIPVDIKKKQFVLDWETARQIPWGILVLFGGGICLSEGFLQSGLAAVIADRLTIFRDFPILLIVLLVLLVITFLNEIASNTAIASIFIPLMAITSVSIGIHPFLFMIAGALGSSLGFMLPVGTPPNAIAYGTGYLTTKDMIRSGIALNITGVILVTILVVTLVPRILGFSLELPTWAFGI